jgi:hypothetical protein
MNVREYVTSLWTAKKLIIFIGTAMGLSALLIPGIQLGTVMILSLIVHAVYWNRDLLETRDKVLFPFVVNFLSATIGMLVAYALSSFALVRANQQFVFSDVPFYFVGVAVSLFIAILTAVFKPLLD